ncbi:MAG: hypothetical protein OXG72_08250 [Acidobacteria bacterium]|nr:hypothetical protein [Acidobacteriota bacterium]
MRLHSASWGGFDIVDATYETGITRPRSAWTGLGAIGFGVVVLLLSGNGATKGIGRLQRLSFRAAG